MKIKDIKDKVKGIFKGCKKTAKLSRIKAVAVQRSVPAMKHANVSVTVKNKRGHFCPQK